MTLDQVIDKKINPAYYDLEHEYVREQAHIARQTGDTQALRQFADTLPEYRKDYKGDRLMPRMMLRPGILTLIEMIHAERGDRQKPVYLYQERVIVPMLTSERVMLAAELDDSLAELAGGQVAVIEDQNVNDEYAGGWVFNEGRWSSVAIVPYTPAP